MGYRPVKSKKYLGIKIFDVSHSCANINATKMSSTPTIPTTHLHSHKVYPYPQSCLHIYKVYPYPQSFPNISKVDPISTNFSPFCQSSPQITTKVLPHPQSWRSNQENCGSHRQDRRPQPKADAHTRGLYLSRNTPRAGKYFPPSHVGPLN